jgi:hypothetical protein
VVKLRHYIRKESKRKGGKGYISCLVTGLISTILYKGHITVLEHVFYHILPYSTRVLLYSTSRQVEYSGVRDSRNGWAYTRYQSASPAIFYQVLLIGQVEYGRSQDGRNR